ncbi:MAG: type II secretion system protein GspE [Planctomycetota bacterium]|nr:MAG: type II secretion system protein GspE [Planctomycetota bacterium]
MASAFDKRLRQIVLRNKLLDESEVERAVLTAEEEGKTLEEVLLEKNAIDEHDILWAVAKETGIPPVDLHKVVVEDDVLEVLPQDLATYYQVLPLAKVDKVLTVAVSNPFDVLKLDDLRIVTGHEIRPVIATQTAIKEAIRRNYNKQEQLMEDLIENLAQQKASVDDELVIEEKKEDGYDISDELSDALTGKDSPIVKLVNMVIYQAIKEKASDIHIEPFEKHVRVRIRVDGRLREILTPPKRLLNAIVSRIKIMSEMDIAERRIPQDGKFKLLIDGRHVDFRVSTLPTIHGEKTVIRVLDTSNLAFRLEDLGFEKGPLEDLRAACHAPYGMVIITGPTGSGKSTTLYSIIREIMSDEINIVTVEDPVEYQMEGVNQVQVAPKRGLTFASALRSILRQDPDVILVGEIRDMETMDIAVKAALTGHLVLTTLHTNDSSQAILRMVDMGVDPFMVSAAVLLFSAQRLARRLCPHCKQPVDPLPPKDQLLRVGFTEEEVENPNLKIYKAVGCSRCGYTGYRGRFALLETLVVTDPIKRMIVDGVSVQEIKKYAIQKQGMVTVRRAGLMKVMRGETSLEEVLAVSLADEVK